MPAKKPLVTPDIVCENKALRERVYFGTTPFDGYSLFAAKTGDRICALQLSELDDGASAFERFIVRFPEADMSESASVADECAEYLNQQLSGIVIERPRLLLRATPFQLKVWRGLTRIPFGELRTYKGLAEEIGSPRAARAVGTAAGANLIGGIIPCHRLVASNGIGGFAWGLNVKRYLLTSERSLSEGQSKLLATPL